MIICLDLQESHFLKLFWHLPDFFMHLVKLWQQEFASLQIVVQLVVIIHQILVYRSHLLKGHRGQEVGDGEFVTE